jgi:hypothetical protein
LEFLVFHKSILLKREKVFRTEQGCRVEIVFYTSMSGAITEHVELSCTIQFNFQKRDRRHPRK